ncbi:MAG: hypothetical protein REH83_00140 [Rickettsiella sp.]|nr:hypothetical protein [Rickettsiella sp.]
MEEDNTDEKIVALTQEKNIIINEEKVTGFKINTDDSENINNISLEKGEVIKLKGTFTPLVLGRRSLSTTLKFKEGTEVKLSTKTEVIQVLLKIEPDLALTQLTNVLLNSEKEVVFFIKNETELDATGIKVEETFLLKDVTLVEEELAETREYIEKGKILTLEEFNKVNTNKLEFNHRYRVTGKLNTDVEGNKEFGILVKFNELKTLEVSDERKNGIKFSKKIDIISIPIKGKITKKLPDKIKLGQSIDVIFSFTNESKEFSATNIQLEVKQEEETI